MALYPCNNNEIDKLIDGTITSLKSNVSTIRPYTFYGCDLEDVSLPNVLIIPGQALRNCYHLTDVNIPLCHSIYANAFNGCTSLKIIDLPATQLIQATSFGACSILDTVILRFNGVVNAFSSCLNETQFDTNGTGGKIYVPQARIASYQADANWSAIIAKNANNQILAIEGSPYEN